MLPAASLRCGRAAAQRALLAGPARTPARTATTPTATAATAATATTAVRPFSATPGPRSSSHGHDGHHDHHHESPYDPPSGWLFGVKPGEKYKSEGWEKPMFWGFGGSLLVFLCILPFKPDTSIQTWALEEARRRLEAEGILADPFPDKKEE